MKKKIQPSFTVLILAILLLQLVSVNANISWDYPQSIEPGSLYQSIINITNLYDNQTIILGEFYPRGTLIQSYEALGVYAENTRLYVGETDDYAVLQLKAKEEYANIILNLVAPNSNSTDMLKSEMVYVLSPTNYGTKSQKFNLQIGPRTEQPTEIINENNQRTNKNVNWIFVMSFLLIITAAFVVKEDVIHDKSLILTKKAKEKYGIYSKIIRVKSVQIYNSAKTTTLSFVDNVKTKYKSYNDSPSTNVQKTIPKKNKVNSSKTIKNKIIKPKIKTSKSKINLTKKRSSR